MPFLVDVQTALPKNHYSQDEIIAQFRKIWKEKYVNVDRIEEFHKNVLVGGRNLAMPLQSYFDQNGFEKRNNAFLEVAQELSFQSVQELFSNNDIKPKDIDLIISSTVTGLAVPSLEARLMNRFPFKKNTKRMPLFGLGCLAGAAGLNRACDYLTAYPDQAVIFFTVELCSLTVQFQDLSIPNIVSTGLFGDGAGACLLVGDNHPLSKKAKMKWISGESQFFEDTERVMGWDFIDTGFKVVLSKDVPMITKERVAPALNNFLEQNKTKLSEVKYHMAHPGGPKVLETMEIGLELPQGGLSKSWKSLEELGNMSSASILFIIKDFLDEPLDVGKKALTIAMGPAFCAEFGLWECV